MAEKILVVDDSKLVTDIVKMRLSMYGYDVRAHEHGTAGLEWLASHDADVVFVDLIMPDMTGLELTKKIRALPSKAKLPIVLLSANTDRKITQSAPEEQPDRILQKPWDLKQLLETLAEITSPK